MSDLTVHETQQFLNSLGLVTVPAHLGADGKHHPSVRGWPDVRETVPANRNVTALSVIAGKPSGVVVLDVDPRNGGMDTFNALEKAHGSLKGGFQVNTPGGFQLYFRHPLEGPAIGKRVHGAGQGVDILGMGAAPTIFGTRPDGTSYRIVYGEFPELPDFLREMSPVKDLTPRSIPNIPQGPMCTEMYRAARSLVAAASGGDRTETLRYLRVCVIVGTEGHSGIGEAFKLGYAEYVAARNAKSELDSVLRFPESDYKRMLETVLNGADLSKEDPCINLNELRSLFNV